MNLSLVTWEVEKSLRVRRCFIFIKKSVNFFMFRQCFIWSCREGRAFFFKLN